MTLDNQLQVVLNMATMDLSDVRTSPDARIFSGRDAGKSARTRLSVEKLEKTGEHIVVSVPDDVMAVNLSFFLGLFGPSVRKFGADGFRNRYEFKAKPVHLESVDEGIRKALIEGSIFD